MKSNTAVTIINVAVVVCTGILFYHTNNPWSFITLIALCSTKKGDGVE